MKATLTKKIFPETTGSYGHFDVSWKFLWRHTVTGFPGKKGPFFPGFSPIAPKRLGRLRFYWCLKMSLVNTRRIVCVTTVSYKNWVSYRRKTQKFRPGFPNELKKCVMAKRKKLQTCFWYKNIRPVFTNLPCSICFGLKAILVNQVDWTRVTKVLLPKSAPKDLKSTPPADFYSIPQIIAHF